MENINQIKMDIDQKPLTAGSAPNYILHDGKWDFVSLRNSHNFSLSKIAAILDVTPATVWHWDHKPASELSHKVIRKLLRIFSNCEIDSILNPQDYFDENGNQIKRILSKEEEESEQHAMETVKMENPINTTTTESNEHDCDDEFLYIEITTVFNKLSEKSKQVLVDYADFLYHQEHGMKLPFIASKI